MTLNLQPYIDFLNTQSKLKPEVAAERYNAIVEVVFDGIAKTDIALAGGSIKGMNLLIANTKAA